MPRAQVTVTVDHDLGLGETGEALHRQQLVADAAVEALEEFRVDYNRNRPHRAHAMMTTAAFAENWKSAQTSSRQRRTALALRARSVRRLLSAV